MGHAQMKQLIFWVLLVCAGGLVGGCGGQSHAPPPPPDTVVTGAGGSRGGRPGVVGNKEPDSGIDDGGGAAPSTGSGGATNHDAGALGPVITFKSPVATDDPNSGVILNDTTNTANVVCHVEQSSAPGAQPIDASSVTLEMLDASMQSLTTPPQGAVPVPAQADDFSSNFVYSSVPNGRVYFRCNAKDRSGNASSAVIGTFVDHGPDVMLISPAAKQAVGLKQLPFEFTVDAHGLLPTGDDGAAVDKVTLAIRGVDIDLKGAEDTPGHYKVTVDLSSQTLFPTPLNDSTVLVITATDKRGFTRTVTSTFLVDSTGPKITLDPSAPQNNDVIGGTKILTFDVTDTGSGVKTDTVQIQVNNQMPLKYGYPSGAWSQNMGVYTFLLDSGAVTGATVQVNVNISAQDIAGNSSDDSQTSLSVTYYLDTTPPRFDLDPKKLQELKTTGGSACSELFDPLGDASVNDLDVSTGVITVRALCYDDGNYVTDLPQGRFAGIDQKNGPRLYVQGDPTKGLLTGPSNGTCNDLDTGVPSFALTSLAAQGNAYYPASGSVAIPDEVNPSQFICGNGTDTSPPPTACNDTSDLRRIIQHEQGVAGDAEPVVYSLQSDPCLASQLQLNTKVTKNGWVCLAVRGLDRTGNLGVSAPIRVCLNDTHLGAAPACASMSSPEGPPSCTNGCTAPPHFLPTARVDGMGRHVDPPHSLDHPFIVHPP
jgi:hypothetical protein